MAGGDAATAAAEARGASRDAADDGRAGGGGPERMAGKGRVSEEAGAGDGSLNRAKESRYFDFLVEDLAVQAQDIMGVFILVQTCKIIPNEFSCQSYSKTIS